MPLVIPNTFEIGILNLVLNKAMPEDIKIKLYTNDVTPSEDDDENTYVEVIGNGYSSILLSPISWDIQDGNPTTAAHPEVTFNFTGAVGNIYGYFIVGEDTGTLKWAERFSNGPFNVAVSGSSIKIRPRLSLT